jgi:hypothetical protein
MGGGARVGVALSPSALREPRSEALVVKLHRYRDSPLEPIGKRPGLTRLVPLVTTQGERKADHHTLRALHLHEPRERREPALGVGTLHHRQRRRERAARVRDRAAAASGPVVECEDAGHQPSAFSISALAVASASGSFSASRPPA